MTGLNKVHLIGHLGNDPESKALKNGDSVCNFNIATSDYKLDNHGNKTTYTEWHRIVAFKGLAKICSQYLKKGKLVYIEGKIKNNSWEDKDGKKRYSTDIVAIEMKMLSSENGNNSSEKGN